MEGAEGKKGSENMPKNMFHGFSAWFKSMSPMSLKIPLASSHLILRTYL